MDWFITFSHCVLAVLALLICFWEYSRPLPVDPDTVRVMHAFRAARGQWPVPGPIERPTEFHKGGSAPKPPKQEPIKIPKMEPIHIPPPPEPPPPPPPPPSQTQAEVQQAEDQTRKDARKRKGYSSTLLSGGGSATSTATGGGTLG